MSISDTELERYARHIVLREVGGPGQMRLKSARVLVVGAGGLGSPALLYLAAAGIGKLGVVDDDVVALSNLQRQVLHTTDGVGQRKVDSARARLTALNPLTDLVTHGTRLTRENAAEIIAQYDLVCDGCDSFETRALVNEACVGLKRPLVSGAIGQWDGQVSLFDPARGTPCYACIFPKAPAEGLAPGCAEAGVIGALPGVVGSLMAMEAIKHITGAGETLAGRMLAYDALSAETRTLRLRIDSGCAVCGL